MPQTLATEEAFLWRRAVLTAFCLVSVTAAATASAQSPGGGEAEEDLEPRAVTLATRDGVALRAWYGPSDRGKEAPAVLIVHEWKGQGMPYADLVVALQKAGCAVLVPEYRGHGGSREYTDSRGRTREFNIATMGPRDIEAILAADLEAAKGFLKQENNAGRLNLNALAVIGVREGAILGAHWAMRDWRFPSIGRIKQGQDVKALVLISPAVNHQGFAIEPPLRDPALRRLPILIVVGGESAEADEAQRLARQIEGRKKRSGRGQAAGFEFQSLSTNLSGPSLVNEVDEVIPAIVEFLGEQVDVSAPINAWIERN